VYATDWSWSPLFIDFDNNGVKDLYISNGIPKRMNDLDYINFVSDPNWQWKTKSGDLTSDEIKMITKFPEVKLNNKFYLNKGALKFEDLSNTIENVLPSYSNGTAYADFDNDGDMDIVVNNINDKAFVYRNNATSLNKNKSVTVKIKGDAKNNSGIGTKIISYSGGQKQLYEYFPVRGFQSSSTQFPIIGSDTSTIDSILVVWPNQGYEVVRNISKTVEVIYKKDLPVFDYNKFTKRTYDFALPMIVNDRFKFEDIHKENPYVEFHREPLIAMSCGELGPAGDVADVNGDGLDDLYIGKAKGNKGKLYMQKSNGTFSLKANKDFAMDSMYEDSDAKFVDVNGDKFVDLIVASGGNEFSLNSPYSMPRLYLNDGKGTFTKAPNAFANIHSSSSKMAFEDINKDGYIDLFLGSRATPYSYGLIPESYILINDGRGQFKDMTATYSSTLKKAGLVKDARWIDIDGDKDNDLVLAAEWSEVQVYVREGNALKKKNITTDKGWWNMIQAIDYDNDGDMDIIVGNQGLNSRLHPTKEEPIRMYFGDFDDNDAKEQIITYYLGGKEIPLSNKTDIEKKIPRIKKQFLKASDFAKASVEDIFLKKYLDKADRFEANQFANILLINDGKGYFTQQILPLELQYAPLMASINYDIDKDGRLDLLLGMNDYSTSVLLGRYDANYGGVLLNTSAGFKFSNFGNTIIKGQVRKIMPIIIKGKPYSIYLRNNDSSVILEF
jgi:enediyne biosynthesis protein E4